jgi:hypothetical protein
MNTFPWIICERKHRWAAALRAALATAGQADSIKLQEVRTFDDLTALLQMLTNGLALVEVTRQSVDTALTWFAEVNCVSASIKTVLLMDRSLAGQPEAIHVFREAGAVEIVVSPRHLTHILQLSRRCSLNAANESPNRIAAEQPIAEWAWSLLPWQDARRSLR